jgi:hypothetical protein
VKFIRSLTVTIPALLAASPAWASVGTPLPEPSGALLMALGAAGVLIGRKLSTKPPKD